MLIQVLTAVLIITSICAANDEAVLEQLQDLISENIVDEVANTDDKNEISAAVRYMIPVPIRVIVPRRPPREPEREPIVAVPIGFTPGRYPSWRPIGPPVIAVPIGSASAYPLPDDDEDFDFERRAPTGPRSQGRQRGGNVRTARSVGEEELEPKPEDGQEELTSEMVQKEVPAKGIHGVDTHLKVSSKGFKGFKSTNKKRHLQKRQVPISGYVVRGRYSRPTQVLPSYQMVSTSPVQQVVVPVPVRTTQVVPVPVYVPVSVDPTV